MNSDVDPKTLIKNLRRSLSEKEITVKGSFLIYLGIAIVGCYLCVQVVTTPSDFKQLATATINFTKIDETVVSEPVFYLTDSSGSTIETKNGIKAEAFYPMRIVAGSSFRVREAEVVISRGSSRVGSMFTTNDIPGLAAMVTPGDR